MLSKRAKRRQRRIIHELDGNPEKLRGDNSEEGMRHHAEYILKCIQAPYGARVLDLGCGDGRVLLKMREIRPDLHFSGMDLCSKLVQNAKVLNPGVVIAVGNCLEEVPFRDGFDRVVSFSFGQYFTHREFIHLNRMLLTKLYPRGMIVHCSIPDLTKRWRYEIKDRRGLWALSKGFLKWLVFSPTRTYDPASYWHHPGELATALSNVSEVSLRFPSDSWYRFDLQLGGVT